MRFFGTKTPGGYVDPPAQKTSESTGTVPGPDPLVYEVLYVYCDASYRWDRNTVGWGFVVFTKDGRCIYEDRGVTDRLMNSTNQELFTMKLAVEEVEKKFRPAKMIVYTDSYLAFHYMKGPDAAKKALKEDYGDELDELISPLWGP